MVRHIATAAAGAGRAVLEFALHRPRLPAAAYAAAVVVVTLAVAAPHLVSWLLLRNAGELMSIEEVTRVQQASGAIYGTALHDVRREHKLEIIRQRAPAVVAFGSSRPQAFREQLFTTPFACACQVMKDIEEGEVFADEMLRVHRPALVVFGVDFWWFSKSYQPSARAAIRRDPTRLTWDKLSKPDQWLERGTVTPAQYRALLLGDRNLDGYTNFPKIGVYAITRSNAVRPDGSSIEANWQLGFHDPTALPYKWHHDVIHQPSRILGETGQYAPDQQFDPRRFEVFRRTVERFRGAGADVVAVLLPVANPLAAFLHESGRYGIIDEVARQIASLPIEFHDFTRADEQLGASTCEFTDAHHGGNTLYARILLEIARRDARSAIHGHVDQAFLAALVRRNAGRTLIEFEPGRYNYPEADFLRLGCTRG